ncbi:hypothetical protein PIIN_05779 [Serendipita indica DSM 11827]|uniref:Uncharacterized protein n=1 Tax=Serendipita indica (strain DSM 11827) TaxID=1109443 RepID=G4TKK1_SERID|nr:hypothetical protein PIIN_05779 [Serendipita indica DSM 11827]
MKLVLVSLLLIALAETTFAAKGCTKAQASAVKNMRFRISYTPSTMDTVVVSAWGGGGGPRHKIPSQPLSNPFGGREYGGGDRRTIYGTRAYGSGYPYGADNANSVAGRPFPYGVWPISWGASYLGGGEYFSTTNVNNQQLDLDFIRPGGPVGVVKLAPDTSRWNGINGDEVYEMIGDRESLLFMMADLVDWCHVQPQFIRRFDPSPPSNASSSSQPRPENVIQYYRASSFAISYAGYNNSFALGSPNPTTSQSFADSSPLPSSIANSQFLRCINSTIAIALPIADAKDAKEKGLSTGAIIGIIFGSIAGVIVIYLFVMWVWKWIDECRTGGREEISMEEQDQEPTTQGGGATDTNGDNAAKERR